MNSPIRCEHLCKTFWRVPALRQISLEVPPGSIYALVGPNGAGKTTVIKLLMNILQPTSGHATILGVDSRRLSPREFASIGYVSENQELPDGMTVSYFLTYLKPFYPSWDDALAEKLLRQFDLPPQRKLGQLSRGMKVKAALASSLAYRPSLIVLDEPFSGLDPLVRDEFTGGLLERASGATVLISSHDLAEIETFASHVGYLDNGRLQFSEEMAALTNRFRQIEITLEAPPALPSSWPQQWLRPETSSALVRFVDSHFDRERTPAEISHLFPGARNMSINPMPLREIFIALARTARKAA
ncbi:MAG: ABC transporter ATP-binding protein [Acidobacteriaceae bacterium]|nr:ABC transporter ATP-binding protein [Acidobacteriaceae bacterium]MBV9305624.1 ABC transporter ATP-binding protein [Acidobacteriaceae bacterium]